MLSNYLVFIGCVFLFFFLIKYKEMLSNSLIFIGCVLPHFRTTQSKEKINRMSNKLDEQVLADLEKKIQTMFGVEPKECHLAEKDIQKLFRLDEKGAGLLHRALDLDQNGTVEWTELKSGLTLLSCEDYEKRAELMFKIFDADGNGFLDREEVTVMMTSSVTMAATLLVNEMLGPMTSMLEVLEGQELDELEKQIEGAIQANINQDEIKEIVEMLFKEADLNEDNEISLEEFKSHCKSNENATSPFINGILTLLKPKVKNEDECNMQ